MSVLRVNEIFYSIQGESSYAGRACVFVRLTGCNLRCSYCDTTYAYDEGDDLEIDEIIDRVGSYKCRLVEVTGGEPLIQAETPSLIHDLVKQGYKVLLETNGSQDISKVHEDCVRILDIKCPSSGEEQSNDLENLSRLSDHDEIKFVIGDRGDYDYAVTILHRAKHKALRINRVFFSPVFGKMTPRTLAGWILEDHIDVSLHLQLHKLIWSHEKRGV
ncbi:MAG: radical SAM protein [Thermodesulfobacteriota bacterium]|nr:radical SAM protein [Thermodesulfobacteriota bacterium]